MTPVPRRRGWFAYAWRAFVLLLLVAAIGQIAARQLELRSKRVEVRQWIIARGGSCGLGADGHARIDLPADRFSRDEIRQIHQAFPTAGISLRRR